MVRNYYSYGYLGKYEVKEKGWILNHKRMVLLPFLFYEQEGNFYEFFTGRFLGTCDVPPNVGGKNRIIYVPESTLEIPLSFCYPSECSEATRLTSTGFAEEAKKHLPYKSQILPIISNYFKAKHDKWLVVKQQECASKAKKQETEDWLDSVIRNN